MNEDDEVELLDMVRDLAETRRAHQKLKDLRIQNPVKGRHLENLQRAEAAMADEVRVKKIAVDRTVSDMTTPASKREADERTREFYLVRGEA